MRAPSVTGNGWINGGRLHARSARGLRWVFTTVPSIWLAGCSPDMSGSIASTSPQDGATAVSTNSAITVELAKSAVPDSESGFVDPAFDFEILWSADGLRLTLIPTEALQTETRYMITLDELQFTDGSDLGAPFTFSFTTASDGSSEDGGSLVAPAELGGTVDLEDLTIPAGHTTTVTSDLVINATGDVVIDGDLIAAMSEGNGYNITIQTGGDLEINGAVQAGTSMPRSASRVARQPSEGPADEGDDGITGGSLVLRAGANLRIGRNANLYSGDGTDGTPGTRGGLGGGGGWIVLCSGFDLMVRGSLILGDGGIGGDATTTPDDVANNLNFPNSGGHSGRLFVSTVTADWPGLDSRDPTQFSIDPVAYTMNSQTGAIEGGIGGNAGFVEVTDSRSPNSSRPSGLSPARATQSSHDEAGAEDEDPDTTVAECLAKMTFDGTSIFAGEGGDGWLVGGAGGWLTLATNSSHEGRNGDNWEIYAGDGGAVTPIEVDEFTSDQQQQFDCGPVTLLPVFAEGARAGAGGWATATVSSGLDGQESHPAGGYGGSVAAFAGNGGDALAYAGQTGGNGGVASAQSGVGGFGYSDGCSPGAGGNGGDAVACGGDGGDGDTWGTGGMASASGGTGGYGGDGGANPGPGGAGGSLISVGGCHGETFEDPDTGVACIPGNDDSAPDGAAGVENILCCDCPD